MATSPWPNPSTEAQAQRVTVRVRDSEGEQATTHFYLADTAASTDMDALLAQLSLWMNAQIQAARLSQEYGFFPVLGNQNTPYNNAEDKALLVFSNSATGREVRLEIPAPILSTVFESDGETVLGSIGSTWAGLMNAHHVVDSDGLGDSTWQYVRGYFRRAKIHRKFSPGYASETGG